jgi:aconitate hydratase
MGQAVRSSMFRDTYNEVFEGDDKWRALPTPESDRFAWVDDSTYIRNPPYFDGLPPEPDAVRDISGARCLVKVGDSVTTDHISPAGAFKPDTPAGKYLIERGVEPREFNSYGSRRGNHEVMMRGTFANVRLRNQLAPGTEGGFTKHFPDGEVTSIFEASEQYRADGIPLVVIAGAEYGSGSSRDWAAKGPRLLGVHAAIAQSYERIHRSNLVGMGILPLEFMEGDTADSLGLDGSETYDISGIETMYVTGLPKSTVQVTATSDAGESTTFDARVRIDTPQEMEYYRHGGILQYVLRNLLRG